MRRRDFLFSGGALAGLAAFGLPLGLPAPARGQSGVAVRFPFQMSEAAWRSRLSPEAFAVLRQQATERPYTSPLNEEKRDGVFHCAGCSNALYSSEAKYDSRTGWPSFWAPIDEDAVGTKVDRVLLYSRTEVHCARCGGHLGHIFDDGPEPTGKRHCINGVALAFRPESVSG
ncbi:peptide-methionine (R)-S-oxide reductase MsrB [Aureimonas populi]|uniref:peptide-methionine (R)-S-oxide reductase n=1 Tax=Aureimonas populi TaxID=1701758 RepID=A0ABW5CS04_9HYPH|nr:peptide-methionine (R)-S-oxide reductase MsrB [Aureimonas populi]